MAATIKAASKSTSKRTSNSAPARPASEEPVGNGGFEPPRLTSSSEPVERVPLFYIDDVEYSIAAQPGVNIALRYLRQFRTQGETVAIGDLLERLLGADGYQALMDYDALKMEQFQQICGIAVQLTLGALEAPKA
jgi:hypothetical protein